MNPAVIAPPRTEDQRREALALGNQVRSCRAELKRDLKADRVSIREILLDDPEWLATMKVSALLVAAPKLGQVKVGVLLKRCKVSPSKSIGGLTERQRVAILDYLAVNYPGLVR